MKNPMIELLYILENEKPKDKKYDWKMIERMYDYCDKELSALPKEDD